MKLTLLSTDIRTHHGLYLLNDLHKASGALDKHLPNRFTRNKNTKDLIEEIMMTPDMASPLLTLPKEGVYASKEVVIAYAMWISPKFNLAVIRAFDKLITENKAPTSFSEALQLAADQAKQIEIKDSQLLEQSVHIEEMAPIVASAIQIAHSEGSMSLTLASKHVSLGRNKMIEMMLENKWLYRSRRGTLVGYETKLRAGYLEHKIHTKDDGKSYSMVLVKPKGLLALAKMIKQYQWIIDVNKALDSDAGIEVINDLISSAPKSVKSKKIYSELISATLPLM